MAFSLEKYTVLCDRAIDNILHYDTTNFIRNGIKNTSDNDMKSAPMKHIPKMNKYLLITFLKSIVFFCMNALIKVIESVIA